MLRLWLCVTYGSGGVKMPRGRPQKYDPAYAGQAYKLCLLGATDKDLANFFDVSLATIYMWKNSKNDFLEALKNGKERADAIIAESLYHRAKGYSHKDIHISNYQGEITKTEITKHYPPDTTAAIFWLKNRSPENWRDVKKIEGNLKHEHEYTDLELAHELITAITGGTKTKDSEDAVDKKEIMDALARATDGSAKH